MHLCLHGAPVKVQLRAVAGDKRDIEAGDDVGDWRDVNMERRAKHTVIDGIGYWRRAFSS
jgi:hypothetical protein